jgi:hypothetical protein
MIVQWQGKRFGHNTSMFDGSSALRSIPAPKDKTWVETMGIRPESTTDLYLEAMKDFIEFSQQGLIGKGELWSGWWDKTKNEHGIGHNRYPGMA